MIRKYRLLAILLFIPLFCVGQEPDSAPIEWLGPFSVSSTRLVYFSRGNLQYNAALGSHLAADGTTQPGTWRFAESQLDYVGNSFGSGSLNKGNVYHNGVKCDNWLVSETYDGWIDIFAWATSGWNSGADEYQPWANTPEQTHSRYYVGGDKNNNLVGEYAYADWGLYNEIHLGDYVYPPGTWRLLTNDEWTYLLEDRPNASKLCAQVKMDGISGFVLLPDDWIAPSGITLVSGMTVKANKNILSLDDWQRMEARGAVFLPASISRYYDQATYWSSTSCGEYSACGFSFYDGGSASTGCTNYGYSTRHRDWHACIRLVRELPIQTYEVSLPDDLSADAYRQIYEKYNGGEVNVTLLRNFAPDEWTTLALPFDYDLEDTPFDGCVYEIDDATADDDNGLIISFFPVSEIKTGVPYLLRPQTQLIEPRFEGVQMKSFDSRSVLTPSEQAEFRSVMAYSRLTNRTSLFLNNNRLYYANQQQGTRMRAFRAYIELVNPEYFTYMPYRVRFAGEDIEVTEGAADADERQGINTIKYIENNRLIIEREGIKYNVSAVK